MRAGRAILAAAALAVLWYGAYRWGAAARVTARRAPAPAPPAAALPLPDIPLDTPGAYHAILSGQAEVRDGWAPLWHSAWDPPEPVFRSAFPDAADPVLAAENRYFLTHLAAREPTR